MDTRHPETSSHRQGTERWAEDMQYAYWRTLTLEQKVGIMGDLCQSVHDVSMAGLKLRHPGADAEELELRSACLRIGRERVEKVLGRPLPFGD